VESSSRWQTPVRIDRPGSFSFSERSDIRFVALTGALSRIPQFRGTGDCFPLRRRRMTSSSTKEFFLASENAPTNFPQAAHVFLRGGNIFLSVLRFMSSLTRSDDLFGQERSSRTRGKEPCSSDALICTRVFPFEEAARVHAFPLPRFSLVSRSPRYSKCEKMPPSMGDRRIFFRPAGIRHSKLIRGGL